MIGRGRIRVLPAALAGLLLTAAAARADDIVNFDGIYPKGALDCLYKAATSSKCESSTVAATNNCFCRNGGNFVTDAAACIGKASPGDVETVYDKMSDACKNSKTPLTISKVNFLAAAESGATTTTTRKATTTSQTSTATTADPTTTTTSTTSSPTPTGNNNNSSSSSSSSSTGISTGALAGTIVGGVIGLALVAVLACFLFRRGRRVGEESHPMLPQHNAGYHPERHSAATTTAASTAAGGRESTAYYGSPPPPGEAAAWAAKKGEYGGSPPDPRVSVTGVGGGGGFNWESPSHLGYAGAGGAPSPPPVVIQELDGAQQFPTGSATAPAEMGGGITPVVATAPAAVTLPGSPPPPPVPPQGSAPQQQQQYQAYNPVQQQMGQMGGYQQQLYPGQPQYPGQQYPRGGGAGWGQGGR
ncbi:hypothetical protein C8A05DRAFT_12555 [Staphylotrichum tortipilum]|uniref:Extracellular membrane protein CFEM domain-containing protein n=1 Tax=Staphylotrichum tortipilum TaxID=2831512 RepID=A0AAN6RXD9_9PEZI|nr:hypothetical protein C8A05DRAFT_12555 [Staphylotrichum longicolle]